MDAKPQRPMRAIRVQTDENVPISLPNGKTIHQRNKSSPALSSMLGGNGNKTGAKRTAFGDVSNIINTTRPSKDDLVVGAKAGQPLPTKIAQEKKSTTFLRPTQRPLSVSNLKGLLTGPTTVGTVENIAKVVTIDNSQVNQSANTRKVLTKRNTTIFKDSSLQTVQELEGDPVKTATPQAQDTTKTYDVAQIQVLPVAPELQLKSPSQQPEPIHDPIKELSVLPSDTSLLGLGDVNLNAPILSGEADLQAILEADLINTSGQYQSYVPPATVIIEDARRSISIKQSQPVPTTMTTAEPQSMTSLLSTVDLESPPAVPSHYSLVANTQDVEGYWDDEEEEEIYDEEGYVTARSYRSKGENTTGGATTVLFPQWNAKTRREISAAKSLVEATRTAEEIEDECYDTSMVAEYGDEIFDYMKSLEVKMLPNAHYMDNQHEIQWSMRSVLMDWLVQVHHRFNLLPETLFLCVNYIDRFLSCKVVSLGKLQLVGATAIFIAAKYEEINCPSVQEIVYMVDGGYTVDEILKAERFMLTMLQFELGWPGPMSFLRRISKADDYDLETRTLAKYFLEVTVMDERFIGSPPSFLSAASHCLARLMLRKGTWSPHHVYYSGYAFSQLQSLLALMLECCEDPRKHHSAVFNKYCDKRYKRAAAFVEAEIQRGFRLPGTPGLKEMVQYYDASSYFRM